MRFSVLLPFASPFCLLFLLFPIASCQKKNPYLFLAALVQRRRRDFFGPHAYFPHFHLFSLHTFHPTVHPHLSHHPA
jgi:hypothetical protein